MYLLIWQAQAMQLSLLPISVSLYCVYLSCYIYTCFIHILYYRYNKVKYYKSSHTLAKVYLFHVLVIIIQHLISGYIMDNL